MTFRILALTQDTGASEDYNLNYTHFLHVSSDTLDFSEPVFANGQFKGDAKKLTTYLVSHGYVVATQGVNIVDLSDEEGDEEGDED